MVESNDLSTTDASNTVTGWTEGQAPSTVNNVARADLGLIARYLQHTSGEKLLAVTETGVNSLSVSLARSSLTNTASASGSTGYLNGLSLRVEIPSTITAVALMGINGKVKHPIIGADGGTLSSSMILAGNFVDVTFDASKKAWQLMSPSGVGGISTVNKYTATQIWSKGADIASADPLVLGTDGNYFDVTGTTTIASVTVSAGTLFMLQFDGILTLTHHATNLNLPGAANITTAAGDRLIAFATAADTVHVLSYTRAAASVNGVSVRGAIGGLVLSNDTDTDHDINVTAGACTTADHLSTMTLATEQTKQIDASWATGNDAGGFPSSLIGAGVLANTWYHVHLFTVGSTVEVGFDTSITAATLIADHGGAAGKYRRIGSVLTDGTTPGNIKQFFQIGDEFHWTVPVSDHTGDPGATEVTTTLTVPTGVSVDAVLSIHGHSTAGGTSITSVYHPTRTAATPLVGNLLSLYSVNFSTAQMSGATLTRIRTNTSAQVQHISAAGTLVLRIITGGWVDDLGRKS